MPTPSRPARAEDLPVTVSRGLSEGLALGAGQQKQADQPRQYFEYREPHPRGGAEQDGITTTGRAKGDENGSEGKLANTEATW